MTIPEQGPLPKTAGDVIAEYEAGLVQTAEALNRLMEAFRVGAETVREVNAGLDPVDVDNNYVVKHEGLNRRERRLLARGKELPEWEPERVPSPGRRAFRNRDKY